MTGNLSGLDPLPFSWSDDAKIFRQYVYKPPHLSRPSATRQFGQNHCAATNDKLEIEDFLFEASGSEIVDVYGRVQNRKISYGQSRRALPSR
jgi:hypothetical protein